VPSTDLVLELLSRHGATATFFCLGWVARRQPSLIRRIAEAGHEVASHGWWHRRVTTLTRAEFRDDVRSSKRLLEDQAGRAVLGYRAPSFSIVPGREWALDVLIEEGYTYDSSLFPIRRPGYGYPDGGTSPHTLFRPAGSLVEFPPATITIAGVRVPAGGGGYFRQFPYAVTRRAFRDHVMRGETATFYIHPWELDPDQPRLTASPVTRFRHYRGLSETATRLERLLGEFRFTSARTLLERGVGVPRGLRLPARRAATVPA
jgi:polysaccharide deacetylase family protein (PEP-CTERM system associated)